MHLQDPDTIIMIHNAMVQDEMRRQLPRSRPLLTERRHHRGLMDLIGTVASHLGATGHSIPSRPRVSSLAEEPAR